MAARQSTRFAEPKTLAILGTNLQRRRSRLFTKREIAILPGRVQKLSRSWDASPRTGAVFRIDLDGDEQPNAVAPDTWRRGWAALTDVWLENRTGQHRASIM